MSPFPREKCESTPLLPASKRCLFSQAAPIAAYLLIAILAPNAALYAQQTAESPTVSTSSSTADFSGTWETTFGVMELAQTGTKVTGTYGDAGTIQGTVAANKLAFTYREPSEAGKGWFEAAADGKSFAGKWQESNSSLWRVWKGQLLRRPQKRTFSGLWNTTFGPMRLAQKGDKVEGSYAFVGGSQVTGKIQNGKLVFKYTEPQASGEGWFELTPSNNGFVGKWRANGSVPWQPWIGKRVTPQPGKMWLVILEAHWERGLNEREYAFGEMLRSYFTMAQARHIEVRHRYFHDAADFRRFCQEVKYLAEPVVLLISTHGTESGIQVGGKTIGPQVIGDALKDASNLKLLHLSGCSMMNGPAPKQILERVPVEKRFPISGYSTVVAWDASAIGDFIFLSMLMIHRLPPSEAARKAVLTAPYLGSKQIVGSAYRPLGLKIVAPAPPKASPPGAASPQNKPVKPPTRP